MSDNNLPPLNRTDDVVGITQVTAYPYARFKGKKHAYALTVDISELTEDVGQPTAKINFVVDNKIVKQITVASLIEGFFTL